MTSGPNEPVGHGGQRLVLRPIPPGRRAVEAHRLTASAGSGARNQVWELLDPWGSHEGLAAALAVTHRVDDMVILLGVTVLDGSRRESIRCLVQQLVAVLRRTDASVVCSSVDDTVVRDELVAAGFVSLPEELGGADSDVPAGRRRMMLQL
jgi:hypothetical protein